MRVCVVGAGAIGGYFGGRLLEAGRDVTFLVRPARADRLAADGLRVRSALGDIHIPHPPTAVAGQVAGPFDLVILSCKAFDLDDAMVAMAPAVGPETAILPLLNGMAHLDRLAERFGESRVLGGQCVIAATRGPDGEVIHLNDSHVLTFGELDGPASERVRAIAEMMAGARFEARASETIRLEMWEKWVFLAALAAGTSTMRAGVGAIVAAPGGRQFLLGLVEGCAAIAEASGFRPRPEALERARGVITAQGSTLTASMMRDIANNDRIEADHVIGDLIRRGREAIPDAAFPRLELAYTHLKAYENRRARMSA